MWVAPSGYESVSHLLNSDFGVFFSRWCDKYRLGVCSGKLASSHGITCLEKHRGALDTRLTDMDTGHIEIFAMMSDVMNLCGVRKMPTLRI